jgi:hypothetical protein
MPYRERRRPTRISPSGWRDINGGFRECFGRPSSDGHVIVGDVEKQLMELRRK